MDNQRFATTLEYADRLVHAQCIDGTKFVVLCNKLSVDEVEIDLYAQADYVPGSLRIVKL